MDENGHTLCAATYSIVKLAGDKRGTAIATSEKVITTTFLVGATSRNIKNLEKQLKEMEIQQQQLDHEILSLEARTNQEQATSSGLQLQMVEAQTLLTQSREAYQNIKKDHDQRVTAITAFKNEIFDQEKAAAILLNNVQNLKSENG